MQEGPLLVDEKELETANKLLNEEFAPKPDSVKADATKDPDERRGRRLVQHRVRDEGEVVQKRQPGAEVHARQDGWGRARI